MHIRQSGAHASLKEHHHPQSTSAKAHAFHSQTRISRLISTGILRAYLYVHNIMDAKLRPGNGTTHVCSTYRESHYECTVSAPFIVVQRTLRRTQEEERRNHTSFLCALSSAIASHQRHEIYEMVDRTEKKILLPRNVAGNCLAFVLLKAGRR